MSLHQEKQIYELEQRVYKLLDRVGKLELENKENKQQIKKLTDALFVVGDDLKTLQNHLNAK